jgi:hypothetical protein
MTVPGLAGVDGFGKLTASFAAGEGSASGEAKGEVLSVSGRGEGCGVRIFVAYVFFGCGDRTTCGSDVIVRVSLVSRECEDRRFGLFAVSVRTVSGTTLPFPLPLDSDFWGTAGGASIGGVSGDVGDSTCGVIGWCCLSVFRYSGVGGRLSLKEE